jgi:hypothetical protein
VRRDVVCRVESVRAVVGFERLTSDLFNMDASAAVRLRELSR